MDFVGTMTLLLVLGLFVVIATAHNITLLEVPTYGDPRRDATLVCYYINEKGDPPLHSVKWYRDNNEIFRFTPGQVPPTRTFNTTAGSVSSGSCNMQQCAISTTLPSRYNTRIAYTCEVSTEGPRFAVVKQTKHLTVAVALKEDPVVTGAPTSVQPGEELLLNCSTGPSMPPANIVWHIDGKPEKTEPWMVDNTEVSTADEYGLRSSWRALRLRVTSARGLVTLRCEATQPTKPPYVRSTDVTLVIARSPHLSMFTAYGSSSPVRQSATTLATSVVATVIMSRLCAFSQIGSIKSM